MSYMLDLDDYNEAGLEGELRRRKAARARGVCDYCGRHPFTRSCMYPERHRDERIRKSTPKPCSGTWVEVRDYSLPPKIRYSSDGLKGHAECNVCRAEGLLEMIGQVHGVVLTSPL